MQGRLDFSEELAELVIFMSEVAISIRMYTPYNRCLAISEEEKNRHILWLADSIHAFADLAEAIKSGNTKAISETADGIVKLYEKYTVIGDRWAGDPMRTFHNEPDLANHERSNRWVLDDGIAIMEKIKAKAHLHSVITL